LISLFKRQVRRPQRDLAVAWAVVHSVPASL
jgi:hypothetical protein